MQGTQLAVEDINQTGGILNNKVRLISEDTQSDLKQTISAYRKLKSLNEVFAIIGPNWTEFAEPVAPLANAEKTILITPTGHTPQLLSNLPYVFSLQFPAKDAVKPLIKYLEERNFDELKIIVSPNAYYEMLSRTILENISKNIKISSEMVSSDSLDFRSTISKLSRIKNLGILVFLLENGPASTFVKQAKSVNIKPENLILGPIFKYDEILRKDNVLSQGIIHFDYIYEIPKDFIDKYKTRFNVEPTYGSALSYDSVILLKKGIEKCSLNSDALASCLDKISFDGYSGPVNFSPSKNRISTRPFTQVFQVTDGISTPLISNHL